MKKMCDDFGKALSVNSLSHYPKRLLSEGRDFINRLLASVDTPHDLISPDLKGILEKVLPLSAFLRHLLTRKDFYLFELSKDAFWNRPISQNRLHDLATTFLDNARKEALFAERLRIFRNLLMLRIAIRDMGGLAGFCQTCAELSDLAMVCLDKAIDFLEEIMLPEYGYPTDSKGKKLRLIVIGMGKLGARELNFSSDIDIIFSFGGPGKTVKGKRSISNEEYFVIQARKLIRLLSQSTPEGFVFRVDTRLRPFGESGPLVMSCEAMAEYYETHGRQWERYALVKASPVAGDLKSGKSLLSMLRPFVYRKYIDYSTIEALKAMKSMILAEQAGKAGPDNVKLGPGGIRDIEFIVQTFQLIKGGRIKSLQTPSLLGALKVIEELSLLDSDTCTKLARSYVFLRTTENRLQEYADMQVQCLPRDEERRSVLAVSMGFTDWRVFIQQYRMHTKEAEGVFKGLFQEKETGTGLEDKEDHDRVMLEAVFVWTTPEDKKVIDILRSWGFSSPDNIATLIRNFKDSRKVRSLSGQVQQLLDTLIPKLLVATANTHDPDKAFKEALAIFEAVLKRSIYLVLLNQNPSALEHLVYLCGKSRLVSQLIRRQPILLDELVSADSLFKSFSKGDFKRLLSATIAALSRKDLEHWLDELRRFKKANILRIAASQLKAIIPMDRVGIELSNLAEVLLAEVYKGTWKDMYQKAPLFIQGQRAMNDSGLGIIAYGKLGSQEMTYSSDLDLVFLYAPDRFGELGTGERGQLGYFYSRLIQRLIFFLSTRTSQGILYEIDTRLRPNGSQGVLVSTLRTFEEYQNEKAWTWEHQALIKARFICGDSKCGQHFEEIRKSVLTKKRDDIRLKTDILYMRNKILGSYPQKKGQFHLKRSPGALVDIEFIVQFLVLRYAHSEPDLVKYRRTKKLIQVLASYGLLSRPDAYRLALAFERYQERLSLKALDLEEPVVPLEELDEIREGVLETWNRIFS